MRQTAATNEAVEVHGKVGDGGGRCCNDAENSLKRFF